MADTDPHSGEHSGKSSISPSVLFEPMARMTEALSKAPTSIPATDSAIAPDWHQTGWHELRHLVMNRRDFDGPSLIGNFIRFPMAKQVWDAFATTYFNGSDATQVYELRRSDVLQLKPFPTLEQAYAHVRREAVRQAVMTANNGEEAVGAVLASRSLKQGPSTTANSLSLNGKFNSVSKSNDWWHELQAKRRRDGNGNDGGASKNAANGTGKAAIASSESQLSLISTTIVDLDTGAGTVMISPTLSLTNTIFVLKFKTPLQALSTVISLPTALMLPPRVFGCVAFVHLHKNQRTKLDPAQSGVFFWELDVEPVVSVSNTEPDVDTEPGVLPLVIEEQQPQQSIVPLIHSIKTHLLRIFLRHNRGKPPDRYSPNIEDGDFRDALSSCQVPTSVEEAMKDPRWVQAMKEEMEALLKNKTWILVNLPKGQKTVGCKWVFSIKYKVDGTIEPNLDWPLHQFDVKNAFLHGDLEEDIYMDIPSGYVANTEGNIVCKLQRTLYGLKQSPRAWFGRFSTAMKKYGFQQSNSDHTLFLKHRQGKLTALIVYVDDMIITGDDSEEIARLQEQLASEFEMKNLGGLKYFLGIEVARSKRETPIIPNHKLGEYPNQVPTDKGRSYECRYADFEIFEVLPGKGLMFSKNDHLRVEGYTDADWAGNIMDRKSTSGYFTFVGGNLVTWRSKKQKVVALSSAEAEFRGMAKGLCELLWLILTEIGFAPDSEMKLFCDNKAAIDISHNPIQHDRTKHVEVDRHFIKQNLDAKIIQFPFVKSEDQLADILTKAVRNLGLENGCQICDNMKSQCGHVCYITDIVANCYFVLVNGFVRDHVDIVIGVHFNCILQCVLKVKSLFMGAGSYV
ncbi:Retrovirus-related Pol polyprotein from transposon RE1 [Vitis vinifera]|uniref:Retrovirus-related Pol polyprotein from transposon RE1 n=1 Tax=Vitis vinifera TaxID=29760 RepID=A0A438FK85_VITVI|nr:Retrovirus-related Pol polyprotein from transposon RE1 [Vitis vinifera]